MILTFAAMQENSSFKVYFAPLQESTDHIYRNAYSKFFAGVDKYFAPYILRQNDGTVKGSHLRDINKIKNPDNPVIPQILAGNSADFIFLAKLLHDNGYGEFNWNLGCPYPMVTNKGLGSGLLPYPERIKTILQESLPEIQGRISVKMRAGLVSPDEIFEVIGVLNDFPIHEVIFHPRIAKQLYRGVPDTYLFAEIKQRVCHPLVYNGDIETAEDFDRLNGLFGDTNTWMIGRGILKNPFLPMLLSNGTLPEQRVKAEMLRNFHDEILLNYSKILNGNSHLLMKMVKFWSYFCFAFPDPHKTFKAIKKAANISKYDLAVNENFSKLRAPLGVGPGV